MVIEMKRTICIFLSLLLLILCCSCSSVDEDGGEQLTYWYAAGYGDDMVEIIKRYNRWCSSHSSDDMKIKLVEFEDYNTMIQRMNIEVMSGGGPDLFSNYMDLPFEKLIQNNAFLDLNDLIENDTATDKIDLSEYNEAVMDAGVYHGKRYAIPAFYSIRSLTGWEALFKQYKMPTEQGFHLTFKNMDEVLSAYLNDPGDVRFMSGLTDSSGVSADTLILMLIDSRVDFKERSIAFDDEFKEQLELLLKLREHSDSADAELPVAFDDGVEKTYLFDTSAYSNPMWMERTASNSARESDENTGKPILYSCFEKDADTYSAGVVEAVYVNANTAKSEKVLPFLKYLLGEHFQNLVTGTYEEYWSGGGADCLPVLNSAFENCVRDAHKITDLYGEKIGVKDELSEMTMALLTHIEKLNSVSMYFDVNGSYYNRNVVTPILQDYRDGKINIDKLIGGLTTATKIYLEE